MNTIKLLSLSVMSLLIPACTDQAAPDQLHVSVAGRATLEKLGVTTVAYDGGSFVLTDASGANVGMMRLEGNRTETQLGSHRSITVSSATTLDLECDGQVASLTRGPNPVATSLAPFAACNDAMTVQSVLLASITPHDATTATVTESLASGGCQWLGQNVYCTGGTEILSQDYLCTRSDGYEYIESYTSSHDNDPYCQ
ncbi:hypothetical protein BH11MYX2_BH11MYX2_11240 [soil metagenome]